jgi:histidinol-phosphate aminotransferase
MKVSRRNFLRTLGVGTAVGAAAQWPFTGMSRAAVFEPSRRREPDGFICLNSNENAFGPSRKTAVAIRSCTATANRYPYMQYDDLVEQIASVHRVKPEQVLLGCGSTEILRVAACAFLGRGKQLVQASPTFEALEYYARSTSAEVVSVPLTREFGHDLDTMRAQANGAPALVYICNPNNPTASITPRKDLETFIQKLPASSYVVMDEAYHHYAGESAMYASFLDHPIDDVRVIVCRTFSKVYGLAGLRLGYGIASAKAAEQMRAYITQDNVNGIVTRAAAAALADSGSVSEFVKRNADERQEFFNQAMARMLKPIDSHANFVMMNTYHPANEVIEHFRKNNILIGRHFPPLDTYIRVSLGTSEEMLAFWRAWDRLSYAQMPMHH